MENAKADMRKFNVTVQCSAVYTPGGTEGRILVGTDESGRQIAFVEVAE